MEGYEIQGSAVKFTSRTDVDPVRSQSFLRVKRLDLGKKHATNLCENPRDHSSLSGAVDGM